MLQLLRSRQELGDEHEKTLEVRREVAIFRRDARELCEIWEVRRRTQGDSHLSTLLAQVDLAVMLFVQGERDKAVELCFQVVHARQRTHPPVLFPAATLEEVARIFEKKGKLSLAVPLQLEALDMRRRDNPNLKTAVKTLQMAKTLCYFGGNTGKAEDLFREAFERLECISRTGPITDTLLLSSLDAQLELAKHLLYQGKLDDAKPLYISVMGYLNYWATIKLRPDTHERMDCYMAACKTGLARLKREEEKRDAATVSSTCMVF